MKKDQPEKRATRRFTFKSPAAVVTASSLRPGNLAFRKSVEVSPEKVRRYSAAANPEGLGSSLIISLGNRSLYGSVRVREGIHEESACKDAMKTVIAHLDEVCSHELPPVLNFHRFQPQSGDPIAKVMVAFSVHSRTVKGTLFAVTKGGNVALKATFDAKRKLAGGNLPVDDRAGKRISSLSSPTREPAFAGAH
ncbi:hypothetical protein BH11PAT4_BH11PAT4_4000 [soil metagenome]